MLKIGEKLIKSCLTLGLIVGLCICLGCKKESPPSTVTVIEEQTKAPFHFVREFPINIKATLQFGKELGGGKAMVHGNGTMILDFVPTADPEILSLRLQHITVALEPFDFPLPTEQSLRIEGIRLGPEDFDLKAFKGTLNRATEEVTLKLPFVLNPERIPILDKLEIFAPIKIVAIEKGRMNPETGYLETHAEGFDFGKGILRFVTVYGGQFSSCSTEAKLCVSTAESAITDHRYNCPAEVWICPGEKAILYYRVSGDVTSAQITPDVGGISLWEGQVTVSPTADTKYKLIAQGACERTRSVDVRVLWAGRTRQLSATPNKETGVWAVEVSSQTTSSSILVTSIRTISCGFGAANYPLWDCKKTDPDGYVRHFPVTNVATSPALMPLVGLWQFVPKTGTYIPTANACFEVTLKCR